MFARSISEDFDKVDVVDGGFVAIIGLGDSLVLRRGHKMGIDHIYAVGTFQST